MKRLIALCTLEGETVLDPFCGSGSTGVACVSLGRNFLGIDLDQSFLELATKRIESAYEDHS